MRDRIVKYINRIKEDNAAQEQILKKVKTIESKETTKDRIFANNCKIDLLEEILNGKNENENK